MMCPKFYLRLFTFLAVITLLALSDVSSQRTLRNILKKREVEGEGEGEAAATVAVPHFKATQFLASLRRPRRNLWDRSRPDVQQWIQQFMYMGYDEARLEADLAYWMDHARSTDQGRQHHYDENSPMGPRYATSNRHGANVNYDYY